MSPFASAVASASAVPPDIQPVPVPPSRLGESPFWHPLEHCLYWLDIPGQALHRWHPGSLEHAQWPLPAEPGSMAPLDDGALLMAMRDGLWRFDPRHRAAPRSRAAALRPWLAALQRRQGRRLGAVLGGDTR